MLTSAPADIIWSGSTRARMKNRFMGHFNRPFWPKSHFSRVQNVGPVGSSGLYLIRESKVVI